MAALPPEDSAIWDQMEEDIAAERWPVPSSFAFFRFWFRGPANELHRRASFRRQLTRIAEAKGQAWALAPGEWLGFVNYGVAGGYLWLALNRPSELYGLWVFMFLVLSCSGIFWTVMMPPGAYFRFVHSYRRYTTRPALTST